MAEAAGGGPADLEGVRQGEQLGGGGVDGHEVTGAVDHQRRVDEGVHEGRELGLAGADLRRGPGGGERGHDLAPERLEGPLAGGVGLLGHQEDEGPRPVRPGQRQGGGELGPVAEQGDDGVGGGNDGHARPGDQAGEPGVAAGRPEPVPVEAPPTDDLHAVGAGGEADQARPGPEAGPADGQRRRHHLIGGLRPGEGREALGQGQAAVLVADAGQDAPRRPGGEGQGGAVGGDRQALGVEGGAPEVGFGGPPGHGQGGDDRAPVPHGHGQGHEGGAGIGPPGGPAGGERLPSDVAEDGVRMTNCHERSQLPLSHRGQQEVGGTGARQRLMGDVAEDPPRVHPFGERAHDTGDACVGHLRPEEPVVTRRYRLCGGAS